MKIFIVCLIVLLLVLHQDYWNWENDSLVFGFIPWGMAYHIGISIAAAFVWLIAVTFAWPSDLDDSAAHDKTGEGK